MQIENSFTNSTIVGINGVLGSSWRITYMIARAQGLRVFLVVQQSGNTLNYGGAN